MSLRRYRFIPLLLGSLLAAVGCDDSNDAPDAASNGVGAVSAASALVNAMTFDNGTLVDTLLPATTAPELGLLPFKEWTLAPGTDVLASFEIENATQLEPVALLLQVEDVQKHFRVTLDDAAADAGDAGVNKRSLHCIIAADVCAQLCDTTFPMTFTHVVEPASGKISGSATTSFTLDCRGHGKRTACSGRTDDDGGA